MKLLTKALEKTFLDHPLYSQDGRGYEAQVIAKFFLGSYTLLVTEAGQEGDDWILFGYTTLDGHEWEWGYSSLREISSVNVGPFTVERDLYLAEGTTVRQALADLGVDDPGA